MLCHFAAGFLQQNKNVLYITLEMAEERIAQRIDANMLDTPLDDLDEMSKEGFLNKIDRVREKTTGKLIVKEYPTGSAHTGHFRHLLNELDHKKNFRPDVIVIDYLNIAASSRIKGMSGSVNSYTYIKSIAEELRALAVEKDLVVLSATQTNRDGFSNSDVDLTNTSESFGLPATVDMMWALIETEELKKRKQLMVKQLKSRYDDINKLPRFCIGVDKPKMRLYDVSREASSNLQDEGDIPPDYTDDDLPTKFASSKFSGFDV
jgi:hypothetical protein